MRQEASALIVNSWTNATIDLAGIGSVRKNTVENCSGIGIMCCGDRKDSISGQSMLTTVADNVIEKCVGYGMWIRRQANVQITNNTVRHIQSDAICIEDASTYVDATGNRIAECDGCAVSVSAAATADMSMHIIEYCTRGGVVVSGVGTRAILVQNTISG